MRKRTVGSLTHQDLGKYVQADGYPEGKLWAVHHVSVTDGSAEPFTRLIFEGHGGSQGTKGLPPETAVEVRGASRWTA